MVVGPRCTAADQAGIEAPVLSLELDDALEEEVWDTAMVEAVSTVMNRGFESSACRRPGPDRSKAHHSVKGGHF